MLVMQLTDSEFKPYLILYNVTRIRLGLFWENKSQLFLLFLFSM